MWLLKSAFTITKFFISTIKSYYRNKYLNQVTTKLVLGVSVHEITYTVYMDLYNFSHKKIINAKN